MDCHEADTHLSLLGYFKEPHYEMDGVAKHRGKLRLVRKENTNLMQTEREPGLNATVTPHTDDTNNDNSYISTTFETRAIRTNLDWFVQSLSAVLSNEGYLTIDQLSLL
jgi:hypothetical protein